MIIGGLSRALFLEYKTMNSLLAPEDASAARVISRVLSASLGDGESHVELTKPVVMAFKTDTVSQSWVIENPSITCTDDVDVYFVYKKLFCAKCFRNSQHAVKIGRDWNDFNGLFIVVWYYAEVYGNTIYISIVTESTIWRSFLQAKTVGMVYIIGAP